MLECSAKKLPPLRSHLLSLLRECKSTPHLNQILGILFTSGLSSHPLSITSLASAAARSMSGGISLAFTSAAFHQIRSLASPDASPWNAMISACSLLSCNSNAVDYYALMVREGVIPNQHTYPLLLKSMSGIESKNVNLIHSHIVKLGFDCDPFVSNSLVACYAGVGDLESACEVFDEMPQRDRVSWIALVHGHIKCGLAGKGLSLFVQMKNDDVEIDEVTIATVLKGAGMVGNVWFGRCIHGFYLESGRVKWDVYLGSALVDMYGKCDSCDDARKVFVEMPLRNVVTWTALIAGYVHCSRFMDALLVFQDMLVERLIPNQVTVISVLTACAQLGALDQGRWVHNYIRRSKLGCDSIVGTALVDMYAKCGCIDDALAVFNGLQHKGVFPWTALINGLATHGLSVECLDLFSQMLKEGVKPNEITLIGVLCACARGGLVNQGCKYFDQMLTDFGIMPTVEHYGCMVDLLGRAGHLEEALCLIKSMPMEPSPGIWGALFGACMIHRDFALGERIGEHLVRMQPHHSGRYALLANMYSSSQKWDEVAEIRKAMKEQKVEKSTGCSWLEVNGSLHEFIAFDHSHPQSKDIYETLDAMTLLMMD
ncbi:pentatricopeptide repeat-containing protein At1g50270 [Dioscorea cayenensis subsp. rotundata]|uniref:Pentatricopeptide repeat-containing protein At1g50270 n=1 Tax=Dioscorea cayennensis subsp. rotundata TaxID=55577 RepID=A0AB40B5D0_DIOCR|nr:pentatricopeptide repeat-containing protein At1g50270 [Dioscorea cayenensis subsp. rotundata]